jgi:capsular exopolysaccharide synthesis family protein
MKPKPEGERSEDKRYTAGVPLARIVPRTLVKSTELVVLTQPRSYSAERFRRLRSLLGAALEQKSRMVVITSAAPNEGKSLIAANLALTIASGKDERVLLLDADLRKPSLGKFLDPKPNLGLADILAGRTTLEHVILDIKDSMLDALPAGKPPPDPVEMLTSERMRELMLELRGQYEWIIIDTPPIVPFTDADSAGRLSDGYILVVRAGQTAQSRFKQATALATGAPILGIVLNDSKGGFADHSYKYKYYYDHYYSQDRKE